MTHIANSRYVVRGERDDGRRWAIFSTDDRAEAGQILVAGIIVDNRHWSGTAIHDRRQAILPLGGWGA